MSAARRLASTALVTLATSEVEVPSASVMARRTLSAIWPVPICRRSTSVTSRPRAQVSHSAVRSSMPVGMGHVAVTVGRTLPFAAMAPSEGRVTVEEGVVYGTAGAGGRDLVCDVYRPPGDVPAGGAPAVLLVHGGSWRQGDRSQLKGYGILLGRAGYVCVAPEYRLLGEAPWPAAIEDVKAAIRWVRASASSLGVDASRIAVEGNSAGAHLALLAGGRRASL